MKTKRDKGFSIVELVVVVAMVAALTGVLVTNIMPKYTAEARACAKRIDEMISECRIRQMSREGLFTVTFWQDNDGVYGQFSGGTKEKLGGAAVGLRYGNDAEISKDTNVTFSFNRNTGTIKDVSVVTIDSNGVYTIGVSARTKTFYVDVIGLTGRHGIRE